MKDTKLLQHKLRHEYNSRYFTNKKIRLKKYNQLSKYFYFENNGNTYRIKTSDIKENNIFFDEEILLQQDLKLLLNTDEI